METELTKRIKQLTHSYKPQMSIGQVGRTIRYADEVWTPNGIVDSIRFEDYVKECYEDCKLINFQSYYNENRPELLTNDSSIKLALKQNKELGICKVKENGTNFPNKDCRGCFYRVKELKEIDMLITAYEVKITKADFLSKNGHNIDDINSPIANENYYCVPKELVEKIKDLVPDHVGILAYYNGNTSDGLRCIKKATRISVPDETKIVLLYNAMKKWCDGTMKTNY